jgi:hypothetical protein
MIFCSDFLGLKLTVKHQKISWIALLEMIVKLSHESDSLVDWLDYQLTRQPREWYFFHGSTEHTLATLCAQLTSR